VNTALIELHYLPSIPYFAAISGYDQIILEKKERYVKQTYRNRCFIVTSQGIDRLVVPVYSRGKPSIGEVKIDYDQKWQNRHWRAIRSAYGKAPFFPYYEQELHKELYQDHVFLYDLNRSLLSLCLKWLRIAISLKESEEFEKEAKKGITDLRNRMIDFHPGENSAYFIPAMYLQVFGNKFVPGLSVLDLIFCAGPEAGHILRKSTITVTGEQIKTGIR
jgi:hypothetical protein